MKLTQTLLMACLLVHALGHGGNARLQGPGVTQRVSVSSEGTQANGRSPYPASISADGRYVAFPSYATNLVSDFTNHYGHVYVHDRQAGSTTRVSVASDGTQADFYSAISVSISGDGRFAAFSSLAKNLVPGDTNGHSDIFVRDRLLGTTTRISVTSAGIQGYDDSRNPSMSADGRYVAFQSYCGLSWIDVNGDGRCDPGEDCDFNTSEDVFVHERQTGAVTLVSKASDGTQGNSASTSPSLSADGQYVAFVSGAANLVSGDTNGAADIFVRDRIGSQTTRVSVASNGAQGNGASSGYPSISADGRYVAFVSSASNLVPADTNGVNDVFLHDRITGQTTRVSKASGGTQGNGESGDFLSISGSGRYVAFASAANNLVPGDTNAVQDIFIHDRLSNLTTRVSVTAEGMEANQGSNFPSISFDGRYVEFTSLADNLVTGDTNQQEDIFVHDRGPGLLVNSTGDLGDQNLSDKVCYTGATILRNGVAEPECSLRAAIQQANTDSGTDMITFNIPEATATQAEHAAGTPVISPASAFTEITDDVVIDASTQPGGWVQLDGTLAGSAKGFTIGTDAKINLKGLIIQHFYHGIFQPAGSENSLITLEDVKLLANSHNGIQSSSRLVISGVLNEIANNQSSGILGVSALQRNVEIDGLDLHDNEGWGICIYKGSITARLWLRANSNRDGGVRSDSGEILLAAGQFVEVTGNRGHGIQAVNGGVRLNNAKINNNLSNGVTLTDELKIYGTNNQISGNGLSGIFMAGSVQRTMEIFGAEIMDNCGWGILTRGNVYLYTQAKISNNGKRSGCVGGGGIKTDAGWIIGDGAQSIEVIGNNDSGLVTLDGDVRLENARIMTNTGHGIQATNGEVRIGILGSKNEINGNGANGILHSGIGVRGSNLLVTNNGRNGIHSDAFVRLRNSTICSNQLYGIVADIAVYLYGVKVCDNHAGGILEGSPAESGMPVTSVRSSDRRPKMDDPASCEISECAIINNTDDGIRFAAGAIPVIHRTNIYGNTGFGLNNLSFAGIDAQNNWWGAASDPGSMIHGSVLYANWLTSPVGLIVFSSEDPVLGIPGQTRNVLVYLQNWQVPNDDVSVRFADTRGWLLAPTTVPVSISEANPGGSAAIRIALPQGAVVTPEEIISVEATSASGTATTSFRLLAGYQYFMPLIIR